MTAGPGFFVYMVLGGMLQAGELVKRRAASNLHGGKDGKRLFRLIAIAVRKGAVDGRSFLGIKRFCAA